MLFRNNFQCWIEARRPGHGLRIRGGQPAISTLALGLDTIYPKCVGNQHAKHCDCSYRILSDDGDDDVDDDAADDDHHHDHHDHDDHDNNDHDDHA